MKGTFVGAWERLVVTAKARARQTQRILAADGVNGILRRVAGRMERRFGVQGQSIPLHPADIADSTRLIAPAAAPDVADRPLRIAWVTTPPSAGSGGHTTMFRMIEGLEAAGHSTTLCLYDIYRGDVALHENTVRESWPRVRSSVRDSAQGFGEADVWIATSWQTAHVLASHPELPGTRMYFVQDYEPYFYPHGALAALAEDSYRFGFTGITAGAWLSGELGERFGMECAHFEFGADANVYSLRDAAPRAGVVLYTKPGVARRGHELGVLALQRFVEQVPEAPVHLFGDPPGTLPFSAVSHGRLTPAELNELYNSCRVGLSLSFTNVSLIPWELQACGVVPVVNDARHNRAVLRNSEVHWAAPTPGALAEAMVAAWRGYDPSSTPTRQAAAVAGDSWDESARVVTEFIENTVRTGRRDLLDGARHSS
ncbi:hypothetical protein SAMN04489834_0810 [Microterricola viridarii]|uniref:Uncharacterized protein n=2 Tax=Microterricola viridarii TaxID=412690 RepID=A0A1H1P8Z3_9MICO|nr:hypothetical protein SAMN04489834_0810 [Microterricola viridarii]